MEQGKQRKSRWKSRRAAWAGSLFVGMTMASAVLQAQSVSFAGAQTTVAGGFASEGVAVDRAGNVFISDAHNNRVIELPADGGPQTTVPAQGLSFPRGVAVDGSGNVYVADTNNSRVVKVPAGGGMQTTVGSNLLFPSSVAVDGAGNVFIADTSHGQVVKVTSTGLQTTVAAGFSYPSGVAVDGAGNVFVADRDKNQVIKLPAAGGAQTTVGSGLNQPIRVAVDATGNVFIANLGNSEVVEVPAGGGAQTTIGTGFNFPEGVAVDGAGDVFVSDYNNDRVVKIQPVVNFGSVNVGSSATLPLSYYVDANTTLGTPIVLTDGAPNLDYTLASGSTCSGSLTAGSSCTVNVTFTPRFAGLRSGALQLADASGNALSTTFLQGTGVGPQIAFGSGTRITMASGFNLPWGVAVDGAGNIFVADYGNGSLVKIAPDGTQTTVAGGFNLPEGVTVDGAGNIFVADNNHSRVVKVAPDGTQTIVGSFSNPGGIAVDGAGNIFLTEQGNKSDVVELQRSPPPTLTFAATPVGSTSADSPRSFTVENIGNASLSASAPGLTVSSNFAQVPGSGTPADCTASFSLTPGQSCNVSVSFTPTVGGSLTGTVTLTDNALNGHPATQTITLSGVGQLNSQTIAFNPIASPQTIGTTLTLSATASSGLPVSFTSLTSNVCTVSGATATLVNGGACTIKASQAGNAQYAAATPVTQSFTILKPQVITFSSIPPQTVGASVTLHAASSPGSGIPITFSSTTPAVCSVTGNTATLLTVGTCSIQAAQAGNSLYAPANPVTQSFTVAQKTQTITFTGLPATATYGSAGPYTLNATASSGLPVTYAVTGPASLAGSTLTVTGAGTVVVTASQAGNTNYAAASPVSQTITVSPANQTITFTGLPATAVYGSAGPYTLNGTASSGLPVTYSITGPAAIAGSTLTITGAGTVTVTASQAGNANYKAAPSVTQTIVVSGAGQIITFGAIPPQVTGTSLSLSATASSGLPVSFTSLTSGVCTVSGATLTLATPGTCTIQASQPGNAQYAAATPVTQSFTVSSAANFTITPFPGTETIKRGVLAGFVLRLNSVNGFNGSVKLTCSGGPSGSHCADLPQTVQVHGTAYAVSGILFPKDTAPGVYTITFTGISGSLTNTATAQFTVVE